MHIHKQIYSILTLRYVISDLYIYDYIILDIIIIDYVIQFKKKKKMNLINFKYFISLEYIFKIDLRIQKI